MPAIQISSGRGPVECEIAVGLYADRILAACPGAAIIREQGRRNITTGNCRFVAFKSIVLELSEGYAPQTGVLKWICQSPVRPAHKRKNWFVEVTLLTDAGLTPVLDTDSLDMDAPDKRLVRFETFRSPGKGGQNVNKVETGVRVVHLPSGLTAQSVTARTQLANKKLALQRLRDMLGEHNATSEATLTESEWRNHNQLERGNPVAVFTGINFIAEKVLHKKGSKNR